MSLNIYFKLKPTCHLKDVAKMMNWSVIEIIPEDPSIPGILAGVTKILADEKISVRQAIVDDFELKELEREREELKKERGDYGKMHPVQKREKNRWLCDHRRLPNS